MSGLNVAEPGGMVGHMPMPMPSLEGSHMMEDGQMIAAMNSFKNILTWTGNVMKAFEFMQWVPVGQAEQVP